MDETHRTMAMHYTVTDDCTFTVRCDPPYESEDGGNDETVTTCKRIEMRETITELILANLDRLAPQQVPMLIEVRRLS